MKENTYEDEDVDRVREERDLQRCKSTTKFTNLNSRLVMYQCSQHPLRNGWRHSNRGLMEVICLLEWQDLEHARKLTEVRDSSQLCSIKLPDSSFSEKIMRLCYTNSGCSQQRSTQIGEMTNNGVHKLGKWQKNERNLAEKETTRVSPQMWLPSSGRVMKNEIKGINLDDPVPCFAVTKNDSHVMSASSGTVSLFNTVSFKTLTTITTPPPQHILPFVHGITILLWLVMDDSSILIYVIEVEEVFCWTPWRCFELNLTLRGSSSGNRLK